MSRFEGHTPGPWKVDIRVGCIAVYPAGLGANCIEEVRDSMVAYWAGFLVDGEDGQYWDTSERDRANAELIAAAPSLLAENEKLWEICKELAATVKQFDMTYDYSPPCFNWRPKARCSNMAKKVLTRWEKKK